MLKRSDLLGMGIYKLNTLLANSMSSLTSKPFSALPPEYIFEWRDEEKKAEYEQFSALPSIFSQNGDPTPGIVTTHDEFAISFTREEQIAKVDTLLATRDEEAARKLFRLCSQSQWDYTQAKKELRTVRWQKEIVPILYRPFDVRFTVYNRHVAVHRRERVSRHLLGATCTGLISVRQVAEGVFSHALVCNKLVESRITISNKGIGFVLPLWLQSDWSETELRPNINPLIGSEIALITGLMYRERPASGRTVWDGRGDLHADYGPQNLFDWIYAVLHSKSYRGRYAEFLKSDFARVPLPQSKNLFRDLAGFGRNLVEIHLLESPKCNKLISTYVGYANPEVERVGWSDGTVWLNAGKTSARDGHRATKPGTIGFQGVPEDVWDFHVGGYQVCHKWLKDRKGRMLSDNEIAYYQKIIAALNETIRIMAEIDEVIEAYGGWPDAFRVETGADTAPEETGKVVPFRPPIVEPTREDRYITSVPLVPLRAAAGAFSDPQYIEDDEFEWVEVTSRHRLRKGMFVAQVAGESMEPRIPDGSWCLFRAPVEGTRQGKTVLVQLRDAIDPETGQRYTVKRYQSEKTVEGDSWRHAEITLMPVNPDFEPIMLTGTSEDDLQVIAELVEVLRG